MSKFGCKCGYTIGFNTDSLRYDGDIIRDVGSEKVYDALTIEVADFIAAVKEGHREEWLRQFYGTSFTIEDDSVVSDIMSRHFNDFTLAVHQCEMCGRIWIQDNSRENSYSSYLPEGDWRGALETPAEGFIGYVGGQDFFLAHIIDVQQENGVVRVVIRKEDGIIHEAVFTEATIIEQHSEMKEKRLRFLSEWKNNPPFRRYLFDSASQRTEPILEIKAKEVRLLQQ